jgi:hypothetical protein
MVFTYLQCLEKKRADVYGTLGIFHSTTESCKWLVLVAIHRTGTYSLPIADQKIPNLLPKTSLLLNLQNCVYKKSHELRLKN